MFRYNVSDAQIYKQLLGKWSYELLLLLHSIDKLNVLMVAVPIFLYMNFNIAFKPLLS